MQFNFQVSQDQPMGHSQTRFKNREIVQPFIGQIARETGSRINAVSALPKARRVTIVG